MDAKQLTHTHARTPRLSNFSLIDNRGAERADV